MVGQWSKTTSKEAYNHEVQIDSKTPIHLRSTHNRERETLPLPVRPRLLQCQIEKPRPERLLGVLAGQESPLEPTLGQ